MAHLHSLLGAEVTHRVLEMLLDPERQLGPLVRPLEPLQDESTRLVRWNGSPTRGRNTLTKTTRRGMVQYSAV